MNATVTEEKPKQKRNRLNRAAQLTVIEAIKENAKYGKATGEDKAIADSIFKKTGIVAVPSVIASYRRHLGIKPFRERKARAEKSSKPSESKVLYQLKQLRKDVEQILAVLKTKGVLK